MQTLLMVVALSVVYGVYYYLSNLLHRISEAKRSGFNYVVVPCDPVALPWQLTHSIWVRIIKLFPKRWWEQWLDLMIPDMPFHTGFENFKRHGEAFLIVSPFSMMLELANAETIRYVAMHREQFPKWTASYGILRQFGENVLTSEGQVWRTHRKVTSASFNERNAALVFREAILQTQGMMRTWTGPEGVRTEPLRTIEQDTMRLALNIIGYVGFGLRLLWPGQSVAPNSDPKLVKYGSLEAPAGHKLSFIDTMASVMDNILLLLLMPKWLLHLWPAKRTKLASMAYLDYIKYMDELMEDKIEEARKGDHAEEGMDLMGHLARTSYGTGGGQRDEAEGKQRPVVLTRDEIIGNAFIMFVAGHETTANTLHFTLVQLATNPSAQRKLQRDIDELVGDSEPSSWDYDNLVGPMTASMVGACMYETLRLIPPAAELPKQVSRTQDEPIPMDGRKYVVPKGTVVSLVGVSVHQNPRYWPHAESRIRRGENDLRDFRPERWFQKASAAGIAGSGSGSGSGSEDIEDYGGYSGPDTNAQLFRPTRGAYIPFSDGARSCLGRRIAQVEIIAALTVLFRDFSLELAVDDWASQAELATMSRADQRRVYRMAQDNSRYVMSQASSLITLKLHGEKHVPVRLVRRGEERFVNWAEDY
ncbi:hypothetical protein CDD81_7732 [Ophiocordyceps australis]|uniref:Cytochrome P450 n=1 Tax=Ophiocordyceps australis TaxID=1399860 RepID=A0A2C5XZR3_9HYPO|nr:hypothetical protein CDD81_7732 [Ophiocordyceps australis]